MSHRLKFTSLFIGLATLGGLFVAYPVLAQGNNLGLSQFGTNTILGNRDLLDTIARIINVALGLLGIIAVGIILYGGYPYMTAAGNEEQVGRARQIIINGVIGLAIILSSYAIANFVINRLAGATSLRAGGEPPANCSDLAYALENPEECAPGGFDCSTNGTCCTVERFVVRSITPSRGPVPGTPTGMNNTVLRVVVSQPIAQSIAAGDVFTVERGERT